ncbi:hypothetical protein MRX96_048836 [Rhipicephalus microplus]
MPRIPSVDLVAPAVDKWLILSCFSSSLPFGSPDQPTSALFKRACFLIKGAWIKPPAISTLPFGSPDQPSSALFKRACFLIKGAWIKPPAIST